jgi:hypothetical protein
MVIFVDVDDTIVRSFGTKRIPIPAVIEAIRQLFAQGETLYCWSRADYKIPVPTGLPLLENGTILALEGLPD